MQIRPQKAGRRHLLSAMTCTGERRHPAQRRFNGGFDGFCGSEPDRAREERPHMHEHNNSELEPIGFALAERRASEDKAVVTIGSATRRRLAARARMPADGVLP